MHTEKIKDLACFAVLQVNTNTLSVPATTSVHFQQIADDSLQLKSMNSDPDHSGERIWGFHWFVHLFSCQTCLQQAFFISFNIFAVDNISGTSSPVLRGF